MFRSSQLLWLTPFASFFAGYLLFSLLFVNKTIITPSLLGQPLDKALLHLSDYRLNARVTGYKDDADLPPATVLSQSPAPGTKVKEHQSLYLTISQKPTAHVPCLQGKSLIQASELLQAQSLQPKFYAIPYSGTHNQCIAQWPRVENPVDHIVIAYTADANAKPVIMPNVKAKPLTEVISFLQLHGITPTILHQNQVPAGHQCHTCMVIDQRPLAGTFIFLTGDKAVKVQLQVG